MPPRRNIVPLVLPILVVVCVSCFGWFALSFIGFGFLTTRPILESDYAHDVTDREVAPTVLGATGSVTLAEPRRIRTVDLRDGKVTELATFSRDQFVATLSGRNGNGQVAAFVYDSDLGGSQLLLFRAGTVPKSLLTVKGDPIWDGVVGEELALAGKAPVIVYGRKVGSDQLYDPQALMTRIDYYRVNTETGREEWLGVQGYSNPIVLSSDGHYLYYTVGIDQATKNWIRHRVGAVPKNDGTPIAVGVFQFDLFGRSSRPLALGWRVYSAGSDDSLLISDYDFKITRLSVKSGEIESVAVPDYSTGVFGMTARGSLMTRAKQVSREDVELTQNNGLPGPRPMSRVIGIRTDAGEVTTFWKAIDPRNQVVFSAF